MNRAKAKTIIHVEIKKCTMKTKNCTVIIFRDNREEGQSDIVGSLPQIEDLSVRAEKEPL